MAAMGLFAPSALPIDALFRPRWAPQERSHRQRPTDVAYITAYVRTERRKVSIRQGATRKVTDFGSGKTTLTTGRTAVRVLKQHYVCCRTDVGQSSAQSCLRFRLEKLMKNFLSIAIGTVSLLATGNSFAQTAT